MWYKDYGEMNRAFLEFISFIFRRGVFPICAKNGKFNVFGPQPIGQKSTITKKPGLS